MTKKFTATERERLVGAQPEVLHPLPLDPQKVRIGEREKVSKGVRACSKSLRERNM